MSGEAMRESIDSAPDGGRTGLHWLVSGTAVFVLALVAGLSWGGGSAHAVFPGTNGKIFCGGAGDRAAASDDLELFSINADGTGQTLVTNNGPLRDPAVGTGFLNDSDPTLSPNGRRVAFASNRAGGSNIFVKNSDGTGEETRLTEPPTGLELLGGWAADGSKIYFNTNRDGNNEIYSVNADGSNETNLTNRGTSDVAPSGSPDGTKIAFHSDRDFAANGRFDVYSMNPDGSGVVNLTNFPEQHDLYPNWSPDGRQIVFERAPADFSVSNIYRMNADGTGLTQLTFGAPAPSQAGLNRHPVWSPDGTRILFDSERDNVTGQPRNRDVYTMRPDGGDIRRVTTAAGADANCDWQAIPRPPVPPRPSTPTPTPTSPAQPSAPFAGCPGLAANVVRGTATGESLTGTSRADRIFAGTGNDGVDGLAGDDCIDLGTGADRGQGGDGGDLILGGLGDDEISGGLGDDRLRGGSSGDDLVGGSGNDTLAGGSGSDRMEGSGGRDRLAGGAGSDRIDARDGQRDRVNCGSGRDRVIADRIDRVARNCERKRRR